MHKPRDKGLTWDAYCTMNSILWIVKCAKLDFNHHLKR